MPTLKQRQRALNKAVIEKLAPSEGKRADQDFRTFGETNYLEADNSGNPQFTPGPWQLDRSGKYFDRPVLRKNGIVIAVLPDNSKGMASPEATQKLDAANATILQASPEMYAELQHTARNLRSMIHMLPLNTNAVERESLESWLARTLNAIAEADGRKEVNPDEQARIGMQRLWGKPGFIERCRILQGMGSTADEAKKLARLSWHSLPLRVRDGLIAEYKNTGNPA